MEGGPTVASSGPADMPPDAAEESSEVETPEAIRRWLLPIAVPVLLVVVVEHFRHGVRRLPAAYGGDFATEYLEHLRRIEFFAIMRDGRGDAWSDAIRALDRVEFPPLLVLLHYPADQLFGPHPGVAVAMNLGWLALAGAATVALGRSLGLGRAAPWAGLLFVLMPGVWGPARAYYYDLPMIALLAVGTAALVEVGRRPRPALVVLAAFALAGAELIKWEAVLYLVAVLPAVFGAALLSRSNLRRTAWGVLAVASGVAGACGLVVAYVSRRRGSFDMRFGQAMSLNQEESPTGGAVGLFSAGVERLSGVGIEAWAFYSQWLTSSSLGVLFVLIGCVAALRVHRMPRGAALLAPVAGVGIWAAVVGVSDVQEVRFVHPALPWLAVFSAAGLAALPGRAAAPALAVAVLLGTGQMVAADEIHEADDSPLRTGLVQVPWPASVLLGAGLSPLPQSPSNQTGWRRPVDHRTTDALSLRSGLEWVVEGVAGRGARIALHPLNRELGRAQYAWAFWTLHRGEGLEFLPGVPVEDCGSELRASDGPWARSTHLVLDFDPALLGGDRDAWCDAVSCRGDAPWPEVDPCGAVQELLGWGAGWTSSPPISYRSRWGGDRRIWILRRAS
jgi:hypothetical protein